MMETKRKILVLTGSAPCLQNDLTALQDAGIPEDFAIMAIGLDSVDRYPDPIRYFATYHPSEIGEARKRRTEYGGNTDFTVIAHQQHQGEVDIIIPFQPPTGSSSMLGILAALQLGYNRIICCGTPLDDPKYQVFRKGWEANYEKIKNTVRSLSGWTRDLVGAPTKEWLYG